MTNLDYLYNPDVAKIRFEKNYFADKKSDFNVIENGIILPHTGTFVNGKWTWGKGGIIDSNGKYIKSTHVNSDSGSREYSFYIPPPELTQYSSETVIYLGLFFPVWGHVITDNIRRLWFLQSDVFKSSFKECPIVYIPWQRTPLARQKNFKRLLEILEVDVKNLRAIEQPTQFKNIILPDESYSSGQFTNEYRQTIEMVRNFALKNRMPTASKKIYYFYGRNQIGEERLADYFKSKGYEVIRPEKLTLDEQLNLLINCESFASTTGSCSHNSIFLRDDMETIFINRSANRFTIYQGMLDQVHSINANYVDSTLSIFNVNHDSFCFIISEQLKRFFGDKWDGYEDDDFKTFLDYVKSPIRRNRKPTPSVVTAYGTVFSNFMEQLKQRKDLISAYNMPLGWDTFRPLLNYSTHVHKKGWNSWNSEEQISNPLNQKFDIQAFKINFPDHKVYYSVYYNAEEGWSEEVISPEMVGTTGKAKAIYGIRIRLDEVGAREFDILYRVHKFDNTWTAWAKNGEAIYSRGVKLNALQIKLEPKT